MKNRNYIVRPKKKEDYRTVFFLDKWLETL